jgi:pyruvate/2-oxoglutarate dehydrogenase complex dihydrolipoamide acyltransferase (E2) component
MKKSIFTLAVVTSLILVAILIGCQSSAQKEKAAQDKVQEAKQDLEAAQNAANTEAKKVATAEEWKVFKSETEEKIKNNDKSIAELKIKIKKPGKTFDALREKKIDELEQQNKNLKARLEAYEKSQRDWESFKLEFNHDMDELGKALKDLTVDNK